MEYGLTIAVVVIVVVPIMLGVPLVVVLTPPAVIVFPTIAASRIELRAILNGLGTVPAMMLSSFVEPMVGVGNALLAIIRTQRSSSK